MSWTLLIRTNFVDLYILNCYILNSILNYKSSVAESKCFISGSTFLLILAPAPALCCHLENGKLFGSTTYRYYQSNINDHKKYFSVLVEYSFLLIQGILQTDDIIVKYLSKREFRLRSRGARAKIDNNGSGTTK